MTQPFLITGLPRSRTAWLAALCNTQANTICHHEPMRQCGGWRESLALWCGQKYGHTGISDSALGFHLGEIIAQWEPNVLVVQRDHDAAVRSLAAMGVRAGAYCTVLARRIAPILRHPLVMMVGYSELSDPHVVMDCLRWLMPGALLDHDKIDIFMRLNIQADLAAVHADVNQRVVNPADMLGADVLQEIRECLGER